MKRTLSVLLVVLLLSFTAAQTGQDYLKALSRAFIDVSSKVRPAVVNVSTEGEIKQQLNPWMNDEFFKFFFGEEPEAREQVRKVSSLGSGFIISEDGYILTNYHVIKDATKITITLLDGKTFNAEIIGSDQIYDIALLKIKGNKLPYAVLGDSDELEIGEWVVAIGNPYGLNFSVTAGIVSALGRESKTEFGIQRMIQTDAAINKGNSGGPLINLDGEVVGINSAIVSQTGGFEGASFAVPINMARSILDQLKKKGVVRRGFLGVTVQTIDKDLRKGFNIEGENGVVVTDVIRGSAAEKAGIQVGDIILKVNDKEIKEFYDLHFTISSFAPGDEVKIELIRNKKKRTVVAKLKDRDDYAGEPQTRYDMIGLKVQSLTESMRMKYKIPADVQGVIVVGVENGKFGEKARLEAGDVIISVNNERIATMDDYLNIMKTIQPRNGILFYLYRDGSKIYTYYAE